MTNVRTTLTRVVVTAMVACSLATAGSGVAGAAVGSGGHHLRQVSGKAHQRVCQVEQGRLAFSQHQQDQYAAQTAVFTGLEASATKAGNSDLAAYWAQVVNHRNAYSARQHARLLARSARDAKVHRLVNGKCL